MDRPVLYEEDLKRLIAEDNGFNPDSKIDGSVTVETYKEFLLRAIEWAGGAGDSHSTLEFMACRAADGDHQLDLDLIREICIESEFLGMLFMKGGYHLFIICLAFHWKISKELAGIVGGRGPMNVIADCVTEPGVRHRDALDKYGPVTIASVAFLSKTLSKIWTDHPDCERPSDIRDSMWESMWDAMMSPECLQVRDEISQECDEQYTFNYAELLEV